MKIADLSSGTGQLRDGMEKLQRAWADAKEHWNDKNSRTLEEHHLKPLGDAVTSAFPAIQHLAAAISQVERECGW